MHQYQNYISLWCNGQVSIVPYRNDTLAWVAWVGLDECFIQEVNDVRYRIQEMLGVTFMSNACWVACPHLTAFMRIRMGQWMTVMHQYQNCMITWYDEQASIVPYRNETSAWVAWDGLYQCFIQKVNDVRYGMQKMLGVTFMSECVLGNRFALNCIHVNRMNSND